MENPCFRGWRLSKLTGIVLALFVVAMAASSSLAAQGKDESAVKLTATAGPIDEAGKQIITIKIKVADDWHAYANDVQNVDQQPNKTAISIAGTKKVEVLSLDYPKGLRHIDGKESYYIYEGSVDIVATVKRAANDSSALEVTVDYVTCNEKLKLCKPPEKVKLRANYRDGFTAVQTTATAGKIDKTGKQLIPIKMKIDDGWQVFANDVGNIDFESAKTTFNVTGSNGAKVDIVSIDWPKGLKQEILKDVYYVYEDSVEIVATVKRTADDSSPLAVIVSYHLFGPVPICWPPQTLKVEVK